MITKHTFRDLISKINWEAYFVEWGYPRRFASVADLQGCDVVRASWLTDFDPKDRAKASEAMQLLKETYRLLPQLDRDYEILTSREEVPTLPSDLQELVRVEPSHIPYTLIIGVSDPEIDLLYENNKQSQKIVRSITKRVVEAAIVTESEQLGEHLNSFSIDPQTKKPQLWNQLDEILNFKEVGVSITESGSLSPLSAQCAIIM